MKAPRTTIAFMAFASDGWPALWTCSYRAKDARAKARQACPAGIAPSWGYLRKRGWRVRKIVIEAVS